jgi:DNA-binding transcriptional regulator YdaS (Cro superfamily)
MLRPMTSLPTARDCLRLWLSRRGRTAELARAIGVTRSTVHRWRVGATLPSASARSCIERTVGIPRALWEVRP